MLHEYDRPLHESEQESLREMLDQVPKLVSFSRTIRWVMLWFCILIVCIAVIGLLISWLDQSPRAEVMQIASFIIIAMAGIIGIVALYACIALIESYRNWSKHTQRFLNESAPKIREALEAGTARVRRVISDRVIEIVPFDDEGDVYIFDLGDGTCLYLRGQEYYPDDYENQPWPAREFEIVNATNGYWLGIFSARGTPPSVRSIEISEMPSEFPWSDEPTTESILQGSPDEILLRLGHKQGASTSGDS